MKLVRFACTNPAHADGRSDAALTIHDRSWAFCAAGADATGHVWQQSDGLPITHALRFALYQPPPHPAQDRTVVSTAVEAPAAAKSRARSR